MSSDTQVSETPSNANLLLSNVHKIEGQFKNIQSVIVSFRANKVTEQHNFFSFLGYPRLDQSPNKDMSPKDIVSCIISAANRKISKGKTKKVEKAATQCESETRLVSNLREANMPAPKRIISPPHPKFSLQEMKKNDAKEELEPSTSVAASIVSSFVGEIVRNSNNEVNKTEPSSLNHPLNHDEVIRAYSGLDPTTLERIKRYEKT